MQTFFGTSFESLSNRNFRLYFFAQFISFAGSSMQAIALAWLAYQITGSGTQLGIILSLTGLPLLLFGLFGGYIGQRYEHHKILTITQTLYGVVPLLVAFLIFTNNINIVILYFAAFWTGIVMIIDQPTSQSFMKTIVGNEKLKNAGSLFSSASSLARIVGPLLGGLVMRAFGPGICFLLNAISFFVMSYIIYSMDKSKFFVNPTIIREKRMLTSLKYAYENSNVFVLLFIGVVMGTFMFEYQTLFLLYAKTVFSGTVSVYSAMIASFAVGGMFGGLNSARRKDATLKNLRAIGISLSIAYLLQTMVPNLSLFLIVSFGIGFFLIQFSIMSGTLLRLSCDEQHVTMIMALWSMATVGMMSLGAIMAGFLSDNYGVKTVTILYSVLFLVSMLFATQGQKQKK